MCFVWKFDSVGIVGSSVGLFLMLSCDLSVLVHEILLTSIGFSILNTVALGTETLISVVMGIIA